MARIFEFEDHKRKRIYLSDERWLHIQKHPEMRDKMIFDRIKETILHADKVLSDRYDRDVRVHFRHYKDQGQFLLVSVKYLNGEGYVITSFYTDKIQ